MVFIGKEKEQIVSDPDCILPWMAPVTQKLMCKQQIEKVKKIKIIKPSPLFQHAQPKVKSVFFIFLPSPIHLVPFEFSVRGRWRPIPPLRSV